MNDLAVVLGLLGDRNSGAGSNATVEAEMDPAPSTIRPHVPPEDAREYLAEKPKRPDDHLLVTTSDGRLIGLLYRRDLDRRARRFRGIARHAA